MKTLVKRSQWLFLGICILVLPIRVACYKADFSQVAFLAPSSSRNINQISRKNVLAEVKLLSQKLRQIRDLLHKLNNITAGIMYAGLLEMYDPAAPANILKLYQELQIISLEFSNGFGRVEDGKKVGTWWEKIPQRRELEMDSQPTESLTRLGKDLARQIKDIPSDEIENLFREKLTKVERCLIQLKSMQPNPRNEGVKACISNIEKSIGDTRELLPQFFGEIRATQEIITSQLKWIDVSENAPSKAQAAAAPVSVSRPSPSSPPAQPKLRLSEISVLIVDDNEILTRMVNRFLTGPSLQISKERIRIAQNGEEGLQLFEEQPVHLVITDKDMPRMNGDELAKAIRKFSPGVVIIMITGRQQEDEVVQKLLAGKIINGALSKPFGMKEIIQYVQDIWTSANSPQTSSAESSRYTETSI